MARLSTAATAALEQITRQVEDLQGRASSAEDLAARGAALDAQAARTAAMETTVASQSTRVDRMVTNAQAQMQSVRDQQAAVTTMSTEVGVTLDTVRRTQLQALDRVAALEEATAALVARVKALEAKAVTVAAGRGATALLALGAKVDVVVPLTRAMPSDAYEVEVLPAAALVGKVIATVKTRSTTAVTLTITAGVAVAAGSVDVVAWRYGVPQTL